MHYFSAPLKKVKVDPGAENDPSYLWTLASLESYNENYFAASEYFPQVGGGRVIFLKQGQLLFLRLNQFELS